MVSIDEPCFISPNIQISVSNNACITHHIILEHSNSRMADTYTVVDLDFQKGVSVLLRSAS